MVKLENPRRVLSKGPERSHSSGSSFTRLLLLLSLLFISNSNTVIIATASIISTTLAEVELQGYSSCPGARTARTFTSSVTADTWAVPVSAGRT